MPQPLPFLPCPALSKVSGLPKGLNAAGDVKNIPALLPPAPAKENPLGLPANRAGRHLESGSGRRCQQSRPGSVSRGGCLALPLKNARCGKPAGGYGEMPGRKNHRGSLDPGWRPMDLPTLGNAALPAEPLLPGQGDIWRV